MRDQSKRHLSGSEDPLAGAVIISSSAFIIIFKYKHNQDEVIMKQK